MTFITLIHRTRTPVEAHFHGASSNIRHYIESNNLRVLLDGFPIPESIDVHDLAIRYRVLGYSVCFCPPARQNRG